MAGMTQHIRTREEMQQWARSDAGRRALEEAAIRVRAGIDAFNKMARIDVSVLRQPVTL